MIDTKRLWRFFIIINAIIAFLVIWNAIPERVFIFQGQTTAFRLRERQLEIMEHNLRMYETNIALISDFHIEGDIIIQPPGQTGAILMDIRNKIYTQDLIEREFHANEEGYHYIGGQHLIETSVSLMAEGDYDSINIFLHDLANYYRYLRFERIQISEEFSQTRLWLTLSIYSAE